MKRNTVIYRRISQKVKAIITFLIFLFLLPYVITIFIHGADREGRQAEEVHVRAELEEETVGGNEKVIREVPWEEYFLGVLALEVPKESEEEMLKAQAVLIRTKLYQQLLPGKETVLKERYLSTEKLRKLWGGKYETRYNDLKAAIEETNNQVLFYGDTYAWAPFHKSSNGMTRDSKEALGTEEYPYLTVRECPLDKKAENEIQTISFTYQEVQTRCQPFLVAVQEAEAGKVYGIEDFEILSLDAAGYVKELRIGQTICSGDEFRDALDLPSGSFSLQDMNGNLRITATGVGHGLGMSQWTAEELAKEGKNYEEILQFFFGGTELRDGGGIGEKMQIE